MTTLSKQRPTRREILGTLVGALGAVSALDVAVSVNNTICPSGIVIHHSALPSDEGIAAIRELHRRRGFGAFFWLKRYVIGYHYIIDGHGVVHRIRPEHLCGAHARGANNMLGICVLGNFDSSAGNSVPTDQQFSALVSLVRDILNRYTFRPSVVYRHSDIDSYTVCPGDHFPFRKLIDALGSY